jgi:hypothetical protein
MPRPDSDTGRAVIRLTGELDLKTATTLGALLTAAMACEPVIAVNLIPDHPWGTAAGLVHLSWEMTWTPPV